MNETYRSIMGEPVTQDGPPAIDGGCAACGKLVDEADLVDDDGHLVCKECAIAAAADRHSGEGAIGYAPPAYIPTKRGKMINFTPMFFVFCFFALVWGGTQIYLNLVPLRRGTKIIAEGSVVRTPHIPTLAPTTEPAEAPTTKPAETAETTQPSPTDASAAAEDAWEKQNKENIESRFRQAKKLADSGSRKEAIRVYSDAIALVGDRTLQDPDLSDQYAFAVSERQHLQELESHPPEPAPPTTAPEASVAGTPGEAPAATQPSTEPVLPQDPVLLALVRLKEGDYATARRLLDNIRAQAVAANSLGALPRLATILDGIAAASIGMGKPELGKYAADLAYKRGFRSRSLILNRAMIHLTVPTNAWDIYETSVSVRTLLESRADDDLASTIYGMLIERMDGMVLSTAADRAKVQEAHQFLDSYNSGMAQKHPGQKKWGSEWLPADRVDNYRILKGTPQETAALTLAPACSRQRSRPCTYLAD